MATWRVTAMTVSKLFAPWNDQTGGTLGRIMAANNARKEKARQDAHYRDIRAQILEACLEGIPKGKDLKQHMKHAQELTDELLVIFKNQHTNTQEPNHVAQ